MSKKVIYSKHLEKGRFYHRGDSNGGHPALIVGKNDKKNRYLALVFTSTRTSGTILLNKSIDLSKPTKRYYVHEKVFIGRRRDFGKKVLTRLKIQKKDKELLKVIIKNNQK